MPDIRARWNVAFKRQAQSDKHVYERLCTTPLPVCHRLHYLQMFLEKLCKAHLWMQHDVGQGEPDWLRSHAVIAKALPLIIRDYMRGQGAADVSQYRIREFRELCREIELLAPAVRDAGNRLDNCEYPWATIDNHGQPVVRAPRDWDFRIESRLRGPAGREMLKVALAIAEQ